ncbi:MAG: ATPase, partial [Pseudomonadota bacterium]
MSRKNQIIKAVGNETSEALSETPAQAQSEAETDVNAQAEAQLFELDESYEHQEPGSSALGWIVTSLAVLAILSWSGLYGWAMQEQLLAAASAPPNEWVRWIIDWSVPVLLVCVVWMLAMRNSTREASRFAASAALLSQESAELESRLSVVNRELSLAREFLAAQSRDLETLGRLAADRLSTNANELQDLIKANGKQVDRIGTASDTALANMTRLRDDLPVIANSARDVNNQVGTTGRTAREQLEKLIAGFDRLNEFGRASESQVGSLTDRIGDTIVSFETQLSRIEQALGARFETLQAQASDYRGSITEAEAEALEAMNARITLLQTETRAISARMRDAETEAVEQVKASRDRWETEIVEMVERLTALDMTAAQASRMRIRELNEEAGRFDDKLAQRDVRFFEEMARRQADLETRETQATEMLSQRFAELDDQMSQRREAQIAETEKLLASSDTMAQQVEKLSAVIAKVKELGANTRTGLSEGMAALGDQLDAKRASLVETESSLAALTEASVRLLEIIQSGAKHSRDDLPAAIDTASQALGNVEERAARLSGAMFTLGQRGDELTSYLITTNEKIDIADASLETLHSRVAEQSDEALSKLNGLRSGLEKLSQDSAAFADETQDALLASIGKLEEATKATLETLDEGASTKVAGLAERLSRDAVAALERALRNDSAETVGKIEQAAAHASGVGREATVQLRDQLARVNELTSNLEQRIERAHELAEERLDNDFARRMALITDSLNSASIDI